MTVFVVIVVLAAAAGVAYFRLLPGQSREDDAGRLLRQLLRERAEGRIDDAEFDRRQAALHASLLAEPAAAADGPRLPRWAIPVGVVAVALAFAAGLYALFGAPGEVPADGAQAPIAQAGAPGAQPAGTGGDMATMVKRLAEKMEKDPANGEGWLLLARAYVELRRHADAAAAFAKASPLVQLDAATLANWADARVMANERRWDDEARAIVRRALAADPGNLKALALAGTEAFERRAYKDAIALWKRMQAAAPADSMDARLAEANIEEAKAMMEGRPPGSPDSASSRSAAPAPAPGGGAAAPKAAGVAGSALSAVLGGGGAIVGTVTLDPALDARVSPADTVFVVARPVGGGAPLAVKRFRAAELPAHFRLDDTAAMAPGNPLSQAGEALVSARLSPSGNAAPQPDDVQTAELRVKVGARDVRLQLPAR